MRAFLSYASEQRALAEALSQRLKSAGIDVFFDRESLVPGDSFDHRIRMAVSRADLFVFIASPDSLRAGAYALTELEFARKRWRRATGRILTVLVGDIPIDSLPTYLRSVSILHPTGDVIAETVAAASRLAERSRRRLLMKLAAGTAISLPVAIWVFSGPTATNSPKGVPGPESAALDVQGVSVSKTEGGFIFTATLLNSGSEAVTIVSLSPEADTLDISFGGSSIEWFELGPGEERTVALVTQDDDGAAPTPSQWRLCWVIVNSFDLLLAKDLKPMEFELFLHQHSRTECSEYRSWSP